MDPKVPDFKDVNVADVVASRPQLHEQEQPDTYNSGYECDSSCGYCGRCS